MSYYRVLGLEKEPFSTSPDPNFFYLSKEHKAAFYRLRIAISLKRGLSVIMGDVGTGKTTLSRKLAQALMNEPEISFHMLLNPYFRSQKQFLSRLAASFHVDPPAKRSSALDYIELIEQFLYRRGVQEQKTVTLLIDEAQLLPDYVLEILRILLNYETNEYKILQLILVGQMELLPRISRMHNFWDRIALKCVIHPLGLEETKELIVYRLNQAGYKGEGLFTDEAIAVLHREAKGYPRRLSLLCHNCLECLVMNDLKCVDAPLVEDVVRNDLARVSEAVGGPPDVCF